MPSLLASAVLGEAALLAGVHGLGLSMHVAAKTLGVISLAALGIGVFLLLYTSWRPLPALVSAILVVLSGHMLWFALSGMETVLFLTVGVVALLIYRQQKWVWLGAALGQLRRPPSSRHRAHGPD